LGLIKKKAPPIKGGARNNLSGERKNLKGETQISEEIDIQDNI